ncbi:uncharacterized protein At4g26485-like [Diospyros lotus]|uniref:uncharacterized protein At4g26485-like n=1 Tax=Diospyros lotus TaxID=55363 RepID=UPI00224D3E9E|nr:uncharacterized protein At4g26485-like [Diospyros lotus]
MKDEKVQERWIQHYSSRHQILLVGEGNFSFSASLATVFGSAHNMVATSLDSRELLEEKHPSARANLQLLEQLGCTILHQVDATAMMRDPRLDSKLFDRIVFNFPHAGFIFSESDPFQIELHSNVVKGFLINAYEMLRESGQVHITHKTAHPFSKWNIEDLAEDVGLDLAEKVVFSLYQYPGYINKRGHGSRSDETFPVGECSTFKDSTTFSSLAYGQANGQAEVNNRTILHGLKTCLEGAKGTWADELLYILWAYKTTSRVATDETPFNLVYGMEALIPIEILANSPKLMAYKEDNGGGNFEALRENLDLIEEQRDYVAMRMIAYHRRIVGYYNSRVRNKTMEEGDLVFRRSTVTNALKDDGKLRANWEEPYCIQKLVGPNTCILLTLSGETLGKT